MDIFCFGAANLDISLQLREPLVLASSNPVRGRQSAGGVARNVAVTAARLGASVALCAPLGGDAAGAYLRQDLAANGVDGQALLDFRDSRSGSYSAVLDADGGLVAGYADMAIYDEVAEEVLSPAVANAQAAAFWFIDANWPPEAQAYLCQQKPAGTVLVADLVSVAKSARLRGVLAAIDFLFCNLDEALALSSCQNARAAAETLLRQGVGTVIISHGVAPCLLADAETRQFLQPPAAEVRDVTGAGDAMVGGALFALARAGVGGGGKPADKLEAVRFGLAVAALTVASELTVPADLSVAAVTEILPDEDSKT